MKADYLVPAFILTFLLAPSILLAQTPNPPANLQIIKAAAEIPNSPGASKAKTVLFNVSQPAQGTAVSNYLVHLVPDSHEDDLDAGRQHVGRIFISRQPSGATSQVIDVFAVAPIDFFVRHFEVVDIDNDGYCDLATIAEFGGSKWGRSQYWIYDPKSGLFRSNWLTKRLSRFGCNEICPDPRSKEIHVHYLTLDGVIDERYKIQGRKLVLVSQLELRPAKTRYNLITKQLVKGKMQTIKVEPVPDYPASDCPPRKNK